MAFASGNRSNAICDRCGFSVPYRKLRQQTINGRPTEIRVCKKCVDIDHEQLQLGDMKIYDPQALRNPRPDSGELAAVRSISFTFHIKPIFSSVGNFTVSIG